MKEDNAAELLAEITGEDKEMFEPKVKIPDFEEQELEEWDS